MATKTLNLKATLASCPTTVRGSNAGISTDAAGKQFAYPCGKTVVVREVEDASKNIVCTRHTSNVTCARLAPNGQLCASGDVDGNAIIWVNKANTIVKLQKDKCIGGAVKDIAWTEDGERVVVVGEGRESKAAVFAVNGGNQVGSIIGHSRPILACDMRKTRPFRIATGGQDSIVAFHEGPPFKFSKSTEDKTIISGNVNSIKYSPDSSKFAVVSGAKDIVIFDGKTGEKESTIPTEHTGSIYSVAWAPDGNTIATASADKSVHLYSAADGKKIAGHVFGSTVDDMQQSVTFSINGWIAVSLGGNITFLDGQSAAPTQVWQGHARNIVGLTYSPANGKLISYGADGKILAWDEAANSTVQEIVKDGKQAAISAVSVPTSNGSAPIAAAGEDVLAVDNGELTAKTVLKADANHAVAVAALNDGYYALVHRNNVKVYNAAGSLAAEQKLQGFDAAAADAFGNTFVIGGEKAVKLFEFTAPGTLEEKLQFTNGHATQVTAVKFNAAGTSVASGDTSRKIYVWSAADASVQYEDLVFHTARINALTWSADDAWLASGSVDSSIILWDLPNKKRIMQDGAHQGGVSALAFSGDSLFSAGGDCCIKKWAW